MAAMPKDLLCVPTAKQAVPAGPEWIHEVKYDGYRVRMERNGDRVRLLSKSGLDWTKRYPWIVETARKIRKSRFILDGEAVVLGVEGTSASTRVRAFHDPGDVAIGKPLGPERAGTVHSAEDWSLGDARGPQTGPRAHPPASVHCNAAPEYARPLAFLIGLGRADMPAGRPFGANRGQKCPALPVR
jgi:hypothetical protein